MVYQTIMNANVTTLDGILIYLANTIWIFTPILLITIYIAFTTAIYFGSKRFNGQSDIFAAMSSAGFVTAIIGMFLSFGLGAINTISLITTIFIAIISVVLLMMPRNRD